MASKNVAFKACFRGWLVWNILKDFRSNLWGKFSSEKECQWYPLPLGCTNLTARTLWSWYRDVKYLSNYLLNKSPNICFSMNCPDEYCSMKIVRMNIVWMNIIGMNIVRMNMVRWILSGWILSGEYCSDEYCPVHEGSSRSRSLVVFNLAALSPSLLVNVSLYIFEYSRATFDKVAFIHCVYLLSNSGVTQA